MVKKNNYIVGTKNSCKRLISKKLDRKIILKMKELQKESKKDSKYKITYLYASKILGGEK